MTSHPRRLRMGLVGGGGAGFIGKVHPLAATLDRRAELVAGAFSSNPQRSKKSAEQFGVSHDRAYGSYQEMFAAEQQLPASERIDFVTVATPNHTHFEISHAALEAGFHVACDKPMTTSTADAQSLVDLVEQSGQQFALTHNYSGYPLVRQAREMVADGDIGEVQAVRVHYMQGWMHGIQVDQKMARGAWKFDPKLAGSGSLGDVGTHAYHLARFITQQQPTELSGRLFHIRPDSPVDDYGHVLVRTECDTPIMITYSQVTHGRQNDLQIEIDGTEASLSWRQEEPNSLTVRKLGQAVQIFQRDPNSDYILPTASHACRLPGGHPEAFFEAFANVYRDLFDTIIASESGSDSHALEPHTPLFPTVHDGLEGVRFIQQALASSEQDGQWMSMK